MSDYNNETDEMMGLYESHAQNVYIPIVEEAHKTSSTNLYGSDPMSDYFSQSVKQPEPQEIQNHQPQLITEAQRVNTRNIQLTEAISRLDSIEELFEDKVDVDYLTEIREAIAELKR